MKRLSSVYFSLTPTYHVMSYGNIILDLCLFCTCQHSQEQNWAYQELPLLYIAAFCLFV